MKNEAAEAAQSRHKKIKTNWNFYFGNQWESEDNISSKRMPRWKSKPQRDVCFSTVEGIRPVLHGGTPKIFVTPDDKDNPRHGQLAEVGTEILDVEREWRQEVIDHGKMLLDYTIGGVALRYAMWDFFYNRCVAPILDPLYFYPDPYGKNIDFTDHRYTMYDFWMSPDQIKWRWGIKEEDYGSNDSFAGEGIYNTWRRIWRTGKEKGEFKRNMYPVTDVWYSEATPAVVMDEGKPRKLNYPNGRHLICINDKKIALDKPNGFRGGQYPIISYHNYTNSKTWWSLGDLDHIIPVQIAINVIFAQILMNMILTSNNQWLFAKGALRKGSLTNQPGLMIPVEDRFWGKVERLDPARIPPEMFQLERELKEHSQEVTSVSDVVLGREPKSGTSGIAIQGLQNAAMGRQRFKMINIDASLRRQARIEFELLQRFGDFEERRYSKRIDPLFGGEWMFWDEDIRSLPYDITVESKAELPNSIEGRINYGMQMMQLGAMDLIGFIEYTKVPVRKEYLELLKQKFEITKQNMGMPPEGQQGQGGPGEITPMGTQTPEMLGQPNLGQGFEGGGEAATTGGMM